MAISFTGSNGGSGNTTFSITVTYPARPGGGSIQAGDTILVYIINERDSTINGIAAPGGFTKYITLYTPSGHGAIVCGNNGFSEDNGSYGSSPSATLFWMVASGGETSETFTYTGSGDQSVTYIALVADATLYETESDTYRSYNTAASPDYFSENGSGTALSLGFQEINPNKGDILLEFGISGSTSATTIVTEGTIINQLETPDMSAGVSHIKAPASSLYTPADMTASNDAGLGCCVVAFHTSPGVDFSGLFIDTNPGGTNWKSFNSVPYPPSSIGDTLLTIISSSNATQVSSWSSPTQPPFDTNNTSGDIVSASAGFATGNQSGTFLHHKIADGTETTQSFQWSGGTSDGSGVMSARISGSYYLPDPTDTAAYKSGDNAGSYGLINMGSVDLVKGDIVLLIGSSWRTSNPNVQVPGLTLAPPLIEGYYGASIACHKCFEDETYFPGTLGNSLTKNGFAIVVLKEGSPAGSSGSVSMGMFWNAF